MYRFRIYYASREYAQVAGDPCLGVVEATDYQDALVKAACRFSDMGAGLWPVREAHNGRCPCGAVVSCFEAACSEPEGHELLCADCRAALERRPADGQLAAMEARFDAE